MKRPSRWAISINHAILGVDAGTSFESFIAEDPDMQDFNNKGFFVGGGGDLAKLADLLRKNFDPCATWAPTLVTDAAGKFSHTFKLPDTLTRYRVIAIAHHDATRFGHAEAAIIAKKDLMLEPKAPRFANQTDTIHPQVLVQNASTFAGTWQITLQRPRRHRHPRLPRARHHHRNRHARPRRLRHPGLPHPRGKHRRSGLLLAGHSRFPQQRRSSRNRSPAASPTPWKPASRCSIRCRCSAR